MIKRIWEAIKKLFLREKHVTVANSAIAKEDSFIADPVDPEIKSTICQKKISNAIHELKFNITPGVGTPGAPFFCANLHELLNEYNHDDDKSDHILHVIQLIQRCNGGGFPKVRPSVVKAYCQELLNNLLTEDRCQKK